MDIQQIPPLRVVVGMLALGALLAQIFVIPSVAVSCAEAFPEVAYLATPYMVAFIVAVTGVEMALVAGWKVLSIVKREGSLTSSATGWANLMTAGPLVTATVLLGLFAHACFFTTMGSPAMLFGLLASIAFGAGALAFRKRVKRALATRPLHGGIEHTLPAL